MQLTRRTSRSPCSVRLALAGGALLTGCAVLAACVASPSAPAAGGGSQPVVLHALDASPLEQLAAREVVRYVWLRTGERLELVAADELPDGPTIVVARADRDLARQAITAWDPYGTPLGPEEHLLQSRDAPGGARSLAVLGGDDVGTLYGAYRLAEVLGVRFALHGDTVPEPRVALALPAIHERASPRFATRGIQPFHDFFEGPDWWRADDWLAVVHQLAKLRMNFLGLHTYPASPGGVPGPEPTVWIGLPDEVDVQGRVRESYPASWASTLRGGWGQTPARTEEYSGGASELFDRDAFGSPAQGDALPFPQTEEECAELFERSAEMLREAFTLAHALGIRTCVGTETPLTVPPAVRERLVARGLDPDAPETVQRLYEGMFTRLARTLPLDRYWLWTDEGWTWSMPPAERVEAVERDLQLALAALDAVDAPFGLATCGWVLGPPGDRGGFDRLLPADVPLSCINQKVGHASVEPAFAEIAGRPTWAIPWLENDPDMTAVQLWVGRMLFDAADALRMGCSGLIGIHWRTGAIAPNVAALAWAGWNAPTLPPHEPVPTWGALGGTVASFPQTIAGTTESAVYQDVRYDVDGYRLQVPDGTWRVVLMLCEPHYDAPGRRVFGVRLQGRQVVEGLDVYDRVGKDLALDLAFDGVEVLDGTLAIDFTREVEYPCVAAIVLERTAPEPLVRRINCGGPAWGAYEADRVADDPSRPGEERTLLAQGFYRDWARASFGERAGPAIAEVLTRVDGRGLPEPSGWVHGPGTVKVVATPWEQEAPRYAFVGELEALRPLVEGPGDLDRFDRWLARFRALRAMGRLGCLAGALRATMERITALPEDEREDAARSEALPQRLELARAWDELIAWRIAAVDSIGDLGTIANLEQQSLRTAHLLDAHDVELAALLGGELPLEAQPASDYAGPPRILVPTVRSLVAPDESLRLEAILLAPAGAPDPRGELLWRELGRGEYASVPLTQVARGVHEARLPAPPAGAIALELLVRAELGGETLVWPPTAPRLPHTVVVSPVAVR